MLKNNRKIKKTILFSLFFSIIDDFDNLKEFFFSFKICKRPLFNSIRIADLLCEYLYGFQTHIDRMVVLTVSSKKFIKSQSDFHLFNGGLNESAFMKHLLHATIDMKNQIRI